MITDLNFLFMSMAKEAQRHSNCLRRQIGVAIPVCNDPDNVYTNANCSPVTCEVCTRDFACPAIHAEVKAVSSMDRIDYYDCKTLYIWAEVPCHNCLSYIFTRSAIREIFCLIPEKYAKIYPPVFTNTERIVARKLYAKRLGIDVIQIDPEEVLQYELSRDKQTNV